ncbi:DUF4249 domain-containing protein [Pontimicrobium aquaticum]|uniref:DUF4249 domain-containing protein n=1 Tax=Pontimicrobium aquaticum TaxID=2565367 RepID=A0A4U0F0F2_9FLAO|nr:DUF4249 domain-containing protein [Pontimicrobium aquaticum]TJY36122.1 DUF4249 domain-containing protein [Pontimicrobium aquaticum]
MKKLLLILTSFAIFSCEESIDLDLNTSEPKLIIEASINWIKGTSGNEQEIKLSLSAPYYNLETPPANNATVSIFDSSNNKYMFIEDGLTGNYKNNGFIPQLDEEYTLIINYDGEIYSASETLKSVVQIDYVEQINDGGFTGEETELKAYYTDPVNIENYYFFEFKNNFTAIPTLEVYKDEFTDGNQIFGFYTEEDLTTGDEVTIRNYGISEAFYEYMFILLQQNSEEGGGPFETTPATVRGNCINETNPSNFPLGYFRLSEVDEITYIVQ